MVRSGSDVKIWASTFYGLLDGDDDEDDRDWHSCGCEETCDEEQGFEERDRDRHAYGRYEDRCKLDKGETCDEERGLKREDREGCDNEETWNEEHAFEGKDQDTQGCSREETCDKERGLEEKDQDLHGYDKDKDHYKLTKSARDLQGYDRDKDYCEHKRRNQALHGCANEKALNESRDGESSWDQDFHGLKSYDKYDRFNENHEQEKKLGRDKNFTFKRNDDDDLGLEDSKGECIIDGESECHEKNEGYDGKKLCTFCGYGYDKGNDEGESDEEELCVLGCLGFLRDRFYKSFTRSNGDIHEDIHYENRIGICDDEDILQKYVHDDVGLHNDYKGISMENLENIIWDEYHDDVDVVSMCGKDRIKVDSIEDNLQNVRMVWDVSNDNVDVVSMRKSKHKMRKDDPRKFDDQGDGRDEGGTCTMHEELRSRGAKGATTSGHGNAKGDRMIWLIGWKECMYSKWRTKDNA